MQATQPSHYPAGAPPFFLEYWRDRWNATAIGPPPAAIAKAVAAAIDARGLEVDSVVDFGCGIGRWFSFWRDRVANYIGYDPCPEALQRAQLQADGFPAEFRSEPPVAQSADLAFSNVVLIHAPDDAFGQLAAAANRAIVCVESTWHAPPDQPSRGAPMYYRTPEQFRELLPGWKQTYLEPAPGGVWVMVFEPDTK